jgi:hypothetical protein
MGAALALPLLDGMVPAFAAATRPRARLCVTYVPNGIVMDHWTPKAAGSLEITPTLQPLAAFRDRLTVVSGLSSTPAMPLGGEGTGDHVRASAAFLTGTHPKKTEGPDIRAGVSMDQLAAQVLGTDTPLSSLELCLDSNDLLGACESGWSCAYANTLAWRTPTTPLPMENDPRLVFERLFGDVDNTTPAARQARVARNRSLLDSVLPEVQSLQKRLGSGDRRKVDQYLDAVREIEVRIQKTEAHSARELPEVQKPMGIPATYEEHAKLMFDLQVLAFQTETTRVSTFMMSREVSPRTYPELGISDPHHGLSHHGNNPEKMTLLRKVNTFHIQLVSHFLEKLQATPDGDGTLLDNIAILYGCCISDGNQHLHTNLPVLIAGGGAGAIKGARHVRYEDQTPLTNLELSLLDRLGVHIDRLGDSTGMVDL